MRGLELPERGTNGRSTPSRWPTRVPRACLLAVAFVGLFGAFATTGDTQATRMLEARSDELREDVVEVTDGVFTAVGCSPANVSMIVGDGGLIIVDTGMATAHAERVLAEFRKISDLPVVAGIYTHDHGDHSGGASVFVGEGRPEIWARSNFGSASINDGRFQRRRRPPGEYRGVAAPLNPVRNRVIAAGR